MKVLIMGASDTLGTYLPDPSQGTFNVLSRELPGLLKEPVELSHTRFYSHFPSAPEHALETVRARQPNIVVIAAHSLAFANPSLGARLVELFGWKAGRWMERRIWAADSRARHEGRVASRVREPARAIAARVIGTATFATVPETVRIYAETVGMLARMEDLQIILLGTFQPRRDGELGPNREFNAGLAEIAASRHIAWIDRQALVSGLGADAFQANGRYSTPLVHRKVADAVMAAILP